MMGKRAMDIKDSRVEGHTVGSKLDPQQILILVFHDSPMCAMVNLTMIGLSLQ